MKKVAGFHSRERWAFSGVRGWLAVLKNLGTIDCQSEGWVTRGNEDSFA